MPYYLTSLLPRRLALAVNIRSVGLLGFRLEYRICTGTTVNFEVRSRCICKYRFSFIRPFSNFEISKQRSNACRTEHLLFSKNPCASYFGSSSVKTFTSGPASTGPSITCERETPEGNGSDSTTMAESQLIVGHDQSSNFFYIMLDGQSGNASSSSEPTAKLEYSWIQPNLVDLYHTEVPLQFRGKGVAKILAKAAFDFFCEKEVTIRPSCTYLQKYLKDKPSANYLDHVEKDFVKDIRNASS